MNGLASITHNLSIMGQGRAVIECSNSTPVGMNVETYKKIVMTNVIVQNCPLLMQAQLGTTLVLQMVTITGSSNTAIVASDSAQILITNCTFENNTGDTFYSGAISSTDAGLIEINSTIFRSNSGTKGGALNLVYTVTPGTVRVRDTQAINNTAGFAYLELSNAHFTNVTVSGNSAAFGAVYCYLCALTAQTSRFIDNVGGAITSEMGTSTVVLDSDFVGNQSPDGTGGAISSTSTGTSISNCTFSYNSALAGGALRIRSQSAIIDHATFYNNTAGSSGGAMIGTITEGSVAFTSFSQNTASTFGGAIQLTNSEVTCTTCTFLNNSCGLGSGGAGYFQGSSVEFTNSSFFQNHAMQGGGIIATGGSTATTASVFYQNTCTQSGAGFFLESGSFAAINTSFIQNNATQGGAGHAAQGTLSITNSTFSGNWASTGGALSSRAQTTIEGSDFSANGGSFFAGALYVVDSALSANSSSFSGNSAALGGSVYMANATANFTLSNFTGNVASYGGGIYTSTGATLNLFFVKLEQNNATQNGGGLYADSSDVFISDSNVNSNAAAHYGGGLFLNGTQQSHQFQISFTYVRANTAVGFGGGMYLAYGGNVTELECIRNAANVKGGCAMVVGATTQFTNCHIESNNATYGGGILATALASVSLSNVVFKGNNGSLSGGALMADAAKLYVERGTMTNNAGGQEGGAIAVANSNIYLADNEISYNTGYSGGGIFALNCTIIIQNVRINNNRGEVGGGIYAIGNNLFANSSFFTDNFADYGAGLNLGVSYASGFNLLTNNTITGNTATSKDAGVLIAPNTPVIMQDTTLSTYNSSSDFCCLGIRVTDAVTNGTQCSYPLCSDSCKEAKGCQCPFSFTDPNQIHGDQDLHLPNYNATCTCTSGLHENTCYEPTAKDCSVDNGGCDAHVTCALITNGTILCGLCPLGFYQNGNTCITLCGDGFCNSSQGEDCVSCKKDCHDSSCGKCGDGLCDSDESCTSCYEDCLSLCPAKKCERCSSHGRCENGICICEGSWSGPECTESTVPIAINTSTSVPTVDITTPQVQFSVGIRKLREVNSQNGNVSEIVFDSHEHDFSYVQSSFSDSSKNTMWQYSAVLSNRAVVNVTFISFEDTLTSYTFGNMTTQYPAHTLKFSLRIANWPFKSNQNSLLAIMETEATSSVGCAARVDSQEDAGGSVAWVKVSLNGFSAYGQFEPYSIIDELPRKIRFELNDDNTVSAVLPHFWDTAEFDPSFAVLVGDGSSGKVDDCGNPIKSSHSVKRSVAIAVPVVIIGVALLAALAILMVKRRHEQNIRRKWDNIHLQQRVASEPELIHERAADMEVNTAAGRFVLKM